MIIWLFFLYIMNIRNYFICKIEVHYIFLGSLQDIKVIFPWHGLKENKSPMKISSQRKQFSFQVIHREQRVKIQLWFKKKKNWNKALPFIPAICFSILWVGWFLRTASICGINSLRCYLSMILEMFGMK